ncbi:MAG TPA: YihY/virulence factor BrkB family protein [Nocardioidaceae bacterium]|nr:YihY/virulence factor BrkB family protein [Nocardioidaceae bacterium]
MPGLADRLDDLQRRRRALGFPLGVVYKFFDDQGNYLAAIITYYAFIAIFPLMLIASSVLGFLLQGDDELRDQLLSSALGQFPIVGTQLGRPGGLQGSASAVVVGALTALYGVTGLGQAAQNALNVAWAIPRNIRLNPLHSRLISLFLLMVGGLSVLVVAILPSLTGQMGVFGSNIVVQWLVSLASIVLTAVVLSVMMNLATAERHRLTTVLPGGVAIAVMWHLLQLLGGIYVSRIVNRVSEMNGVFALVLGLVALLYVAGVMAILGIQLNVVLAKHLYPRALLTPFTDDVELTDADRRVYTEYAQAQRHKGFERVRVTFEPDTDAPADGG